MPTMPGSPPARRRSCSTRRPSFRSTSRGGGPGTRETDLLDPSRTVDRIDAIALSGGSAFGLDAAGGRAGLSAQHRPRLCGRNRAGAAGARRRSCSISSTAATRSGAATRPIASSALRRREAARRRLRARQRRRRARRHHGQFQGRHRLGIGGDRRRLHRCGARRRQRGRQRGGRRRPVVLGGPVRAGRRIRRPRLPGDGAAGAPCCRAPRARCA